MRLIWFETRSAIVATGLLFGAAAIARADGVPIPASDLVVVNSHDSCANDFSSSCDDTAGKPASLPSSHLHKQFAYHRFAKHHPTVVAARQPLGSEQVAFQQLSCTGASAWSLLCPGTQVIGISY
jgi:hypothetical protein